jgi:hypothetical protein
MGGCTPSIHLKGGRGNFLGEEGYESIKFTFLGVAGLYMLINKKNPERF